MAAQRQNDQAESLSHLTQALEQLSAEHAHSLAAVESRCTDAQTEQQHLHEQQLQDQSMEHDPLLTDTISHWQERLQLAEAAHSAEMTHLSAQNESYMCNVSQASEAAEQLHTVRLVNLQLELQQVQNKLKAEIVAAQAQHDATSSELQNQLQVCIFTTMFCVF